MTKPGDEVLTFAPYFPEYGPYVEGTGAVLKVVPPQAPAFQPNLDAFEEMLTENVTCVLINTPNNPTGVVYSAETLSRLADILTEKSKAFGQFLLSCFFKFVPLFLFLTFHKILVRHHFLII